MMTQIGLCGRMVGKCNRAGGCLHPKALLYYSSPRREDTVASQSDAKTSQMSFAINEFHAVAVATTKVMPTALASYLDAMFMHPPDPKSMFEYIENKVTPVVDELVLLEEARVAAEVKSNDCAYTAFDVGHASQRNSQQSTAAFAELNTRKLLKVVVDTEGRSEMREPRMLLQCCQHADRCQLRSNTSASPSVLTWNAVSQHTSTAMCGMIASRRCLRLSGLHLEVPATTRRHMHGMHVWSMRIGAPFRDVGRHG
eukprot:SAG31_NODE_4388_length_3277_cov_9.846564_3_plen_255_part_00